MSGKTYADEATLTAHLDKLLSTATTPTQAESLYTDTTITTDNLLSGHLLANENLSTLGIPPLPPLPTKPDTKPCEDLLAATFTAIVKLARCAVANKNLREGAESSLRASTKRVEELTTRLGGAETRVKKKDMLIASLQNASDDLVTRHRAQVKKLSAECGQLRSRLLHASHRENQLVMSMKKKEKEFGQLQSRVHALFKNSRPIEQRITRVGTRASPKGQESLEADVAELGEERVTAVEGENDVMRGLLQAVQEELDDLILSHSGDSGSAVSEELDVPPAPGDEVMQLPMDVIGDVLQDSLERKFVLLRKVLEHGGSVQELEPEDNGDLVEEYGESEDDATGHVEEVYSPNSAHRSVDVMSASIEKPADDSEAHQAEPEGAATPAEAEEMDGAAQSADAEPEGEATPAEAEEVGGAAKSADAEPEVEAIPAEAEMDEVAQSADAEPNVEETDISVPTDVGSGNQPTEGDIANSSELDAEAAPIDVVPLSEINPAGISNNAEATTTADKAENIQETLDALSTLSLNEPTGAPSVPTASNP